MYRMEIYYIVDYLLFTFFSSLGVLQIALSKGASKSFNLGIVVVIGSYLWFFSVADRNIPTVLEGVQLFVVFGLGASLAIFITKNLPILIKNK